MADNKNKVRNYYRYSTKCLACDFTQSYKGLNKSEGYSTFLDVLKNMDIWNFGYRCCDNCKSTTRTILISYDER